MSGWIGHSDYKLFYRESDNRPLIMRVRELAWERVENGDEEFVCFYSAALEVGCSDDEAERLNIELNKRDMRSRGVI
jgi:hypothetical protein